MTRRELGFIVGFFILVLLLSTTARFFFGWVGLLVLAGLWLIGTIIVLIRMRDKATK